MKELTIKRVRNTSLPDIWGQFFSEQLDGRGRVAALELIMLFVSSIDRDIRNLGHRLSLLYARTTGDLSAVHAVASMNGMIPVVKMCERIQGIEHDLTRRDSEGFVALMRESFSELMRDGEVYYTVGQRAFYNQFFNQLDVAVSAVAPTSYGKSSLIVDYVEKSDGNFCVIVPTKSLLAQTRKMLFQGLSDEALKKKKIITHHEMYSGGDASVVAILTQERFLRLLLDYPALSFAHMVIDESHNLLHNDSRSRALASAVILAFRRNHALRVKFLSPFVGASENLKLRFVDLDIRHLGTLEYVKSELFYYVDFREQSSSVRKTVYDQFMDRSYIVGDRLDNDLRAYVVGNAAGKNIVYINRPIKTHEFARELIEILPEVTAPEIDRACRDISSYLDSSYFLIKCLRHGVVFHHGSVPDNVRLYIENLYTSVGSIRYVVTTSTLLEGVNLPAEKMFLLDVKKGNRNLTPAQLKNLIGRVSRFGDLFRKNHLKGLLPEVHFVAGKYFPSVTSNVESYVRKSLKVGLPVRDVVENPMLQGVGIEAGKVKEAFNEELMFLSSFEEGFADQADFEIEAPGTQVGRLCVLHRILDFNVMQVENSMQLTVDRLISASYKVVDSKGVINVIKEVFIDNIAEMELGLSEDLSRLRDNVKAREFYAMVLRWRTEGYTYNRMIEQFVRYWMRIANDPELRIVFAGPWGTRSRDLNVNPDFHRYVDVSRMSRPELVTLAVARIEAEMNFLDFNVMKYIDCLMELGLVDDGYYNLLRYGSVEDGVKELIEAGMSHSLAALIDGSYSRHLVHYESGAIGLREDIREEMYGDGVNDILVNEASYYIRSGGRK